MSKGVNDIIVTEDEIFLFVRKPSVLEKIPFIDSSLINAKYLTLTKRKTIKEPKYECINNKS